MGGVPKWGHLVITLLDHLMTCQHDVHDVQHMCMYMYPLCPI